MRFAALETSTEWCSAALWLEGEVLALEERAGQRQSERLLPMLEALLARAGLGVAALDAVAFGAGPGSFTGLRIACGVAQGLALGRGLPVAAVSTLEAIAEESGAERVLACLDARMHEVYYAALERDPARPGRWREVVAAQCVAPQAAPAPPGEGWVGAGGGFLPYGELLRSRFSATSPMAAMHPEVHPTAFAVARLAAPRLAAGEGVDAGLAAPVYLRDRVAFTAAELAAR